MDSRSIILLPKLMKLLLFAEERVYPLTLINMFSASEE